MATKDETEILCRSNGFFRRRITEDYLGDQADVIKQTAMTIPVQINGIGKINNKYPFWTHIQSKGSNVFVFTRLNELKLNTQWRVYGEKKERCYPCWFKGAPPDIENGELPTAAELDFGATHIWPLPSNMALWFVAMYTSATLRYGAGESDLITLMTGGLEKAFLLAVKTNSGGLFKLPMCNIFQDSSICMGTYGMDDPFKVPVMEKLSHAIEHFRNSPWNHHLREHSKNSDSRAIFSMTIDGKSPVDTPTDWDKHCVKVNSAYYSDLNLINLTKAKI